MLMLGMLEQLGSVKATIIKMESTDQTSINHIKLFSLNSVLSSLNFEYTCVLERRILGAVDSPRFTRDSISISDIIKVYK